MYTLLLPPTHTHTALNTLMQLLRGESVDFWLVGQNQPAMFERGGEYYQQVVDQYGGQLKTGTHLQFREFPNKVFAFNAEKQRLELCLGECVCAWVSVCVCVSVPG